MLRNEHLTDRELLLWMDGELSPAKDHLDACRLCRGRVAKLDAAMAEFADAYSGEIDPRLPAPAVSRATLRQRLEEAEAGRGWHRAAMAASLMAACLAVFAVNERGLLHHSRDSPVPRNTLTPGETRDVSVADVCRNPAETAESVPASLRQEVFHEYGIRETRGSAYEVDYLITPQLGGANSIRNLWPQPYSAEWNAHVKDALEDRLHGLVCAGQVDLPTAQREIAQDWIGAYKKYFHTDRPL